MNKTELRDKLKTLRAQMDKETVIKKSEKIIYRLVNCEEFKGAENIMIYMSLGNEVCTDKLIDLGAEMGKKLYVPVTVGDDILPCKLEGHGGLGKGKFGIREPIDKDVMTGEIDLVIVPGIGFSKDGGRIGFGKGYYDRFLKDKNSKKIALAYSFQVVDDTFAEENDIPMDKIVTEEEMICCEQR